jgi:hypothetical protein
MSLCYFIQFNKIDFIYEILNFKMDYFGLIKDDDNTQIFQEPIFSSNSNNTFDPNMMPIGFGCAEPGCKNKESSFGSYSLPFCDSNPVCMKRNLEYLSLQNAKLKGEIGAMEFILSKYSYLGLNRENSSVSLPMDTSLEIE